MHAASGICCLRQQTKQALALLNVLIQAYRSEQSLSVLSAKSVVKLFLVPRTLNHQLPTINQRPHRPAQPAKGIARAQSGHLMVPCSA